MLVGLSHRDRDSLESPRSELVFMTGTGNDQNPVPWSGKEGTMPWKAKHRSSRRARSRREWRDFGRGRAVNWVPKVGRTLKIGLIKKQSYFCSRGLSRSS